MRTIAVCNLKGGVAKTATVINMAAVLAKDYKQMVLVIDKELTGLGQQFTKWTLLPKDG